MPIHDWSRVLEMGIFQDFHLSWIFTIRHALNARLLPPDFYALAEAVAGGLGADVLTLQRKHSVESSNGNGTHSVDDDSMGGVLLATSPPQTRLQGEIEIEKRTRRRWRIAIRHRSDDRVVAFVEIVSPGNKSSRDAIRSFVRKSVELIDSGIHLLVLDLIPPSERDPNGIHDLIWTELTGSGFKMPEGLPLTLVSYLADETWRWWIEPVAVGNVLPDMPLFLSPKRYVSIPLEETYQTAFNAGPKRWRDVLEA